MGLIAVILWPLYPKRLAGVPSAFEMAESQEIVKPRPARRPVRSAWRALLRLNRGYNGVDRAASGALGFNTVVKVIGWVGLCAVVFILVQKVREIEAELDPVERGISQLGHQVDRAQVDMGSETRASQQELTSLQERARSLKQALDVASQEHSRRGAKSLQEADREAQELADQLGRDEESAKAIATQREAVAKALSDYVQGLDGAKGVLAAQSQALTTEAAGLADGGTEAASALRALEVQAREQSRSLSQVKPEEALGEVTVRAQALAGRLERLEARLAKLEAALPAELPRAKVAPAEGGAQSPTASRPGKLPKKRAEPDEAASESPPP
ncbi:MAG: hypothetical protein ACYCWW_11175 [Deltaproteobacteria bacterium]